MPGTSYQWRTAELEALKEYDPGVITALYSQIPQSPLPRGHVSFSYMIKAIVDAEEALIDAENANLVSV